jgi:hypothetical protein
MSLQEGTDAAPGYRREGPRDEQIIHTGKIVATHKLFYVDFKRNSRGQFLKITEKDGRFRTTIIIPEEAIRPMADVINDIATHHLVLNEQRPAQPASQPAAAAEQLPA